MPDTSDKRNEVFKNFIDKMEVAYAVLLAWGYARIAEYFIHDLRYLSGAIIGGLVLIRFFFAASHNLKPIAEKTEGSIAKQRILFLWDVPLLCVHSFVYYRMCVLLSRYDYHNFYLAFCVLLSFNIIWLISINKRIDPAGKNHLLWCSKWTCNNAAHLAAMFIFLFYRIEYLLFWVALSNCLFDFMMTASDYLGFKNKR
jgi:hypothetical protein